MARKQRSSSRLSWPSPDTIDVHVGARIQLRRQHLGLTQVALAKAIGISFQQLQKYERGVNRVGASRLFDLGRVLRVPIAHFFDEIGPEVAKRRAGIMDRSRHPVPVADLIAKREAFGLMRCYYAISDRQLRRRFTDLVRAIADST